MNSPTHHTPRPDHTPDSFEARLRHRLREAPVDLPTAPGPHAAADRANERSRRRRTALVAAASVALVGGLASPIVFDDDGAEGVNTDVAGPVSGDGVDLDWQVHDDGLSMVTSAADGPDGFYALSTGPDTRWQDFPDGNAPRALYRWADGAWAPVELDDGDPDLARVTGRDGTLYGLSTAADTGAPVGSVSTDGGESWTSVALSAVEPPSTTVDWGLTVGLDLASTADTTVGVVTVRFLVPADDLFPELSSEPSEGTYVAWRATDQGVQLVEVTESTDDASGPSTTARPDAGGADATSDETVIRTVPWSDLGVTGPEAVEPRVTTYLADGETWTPTGATLDGHGTNGVVATDAGILLQTLRETVDGEQWTSHVFHTVDGATWQPVPTPDATWGQTALAPDGSLLHLTGDGGSLGSYTISVSRDLGASWNTIDLSSVLPDGSARDFHFSIPTTGPLGVALVAHHGGDDSDGLESDLLFSTDLRSWSVSDLDELTPGDAPFVGQVFVGTDHVVVQATGPSDPDDGEPGPTATLVGTPVR